MALILNVEDNEITRYIRTQVLTQAGFRVVEAGTCREAIAALEDTPFEVVMLDVNLPDGSGFDLCRIAKERPSTHSIVIHVSSSHVGTNAQVTGLENGADVYLCEPVEPQLLVATVRSMLRTRQAEMERAESEARLRLVLDQILQKLRNLRGVRSDHRKLVEFNHRFALRDCFIQIQHNMIHHRIQRDRFRV